MPGGRAAFTPGLGCHWAWGSIGKVLLVKWRQRVRHKQKKLRFDGVGGGQYGPRKVGFYACCSLWVTETPGPVGRHILSFISIPDGFCRSKVRLSAAGTLLMSVGFCCREAGSPFNYTRY